MALSRVWMPSPNYSSRGGVTPTKLVLHTAEGATTIESLGNWFAQPSSQVSSHVGIDDKRGQVGEYVKRGNKAWTQANYNPQSIAAELCGFASWSRDEWFRHENMLRNTADWLAEESAAAGIPLTQLTSSQAQGSGVGVCQHADLGAGGGGHWDCGSSFPIADVIAWAKGGTTPPEPIAPPLPPEDEMATYGFGNVTQAVPRWLCTFPRGGPDRFTVFADASAENPIVIQHAVHYAGRWAQQNTVSITSANPWTLQFSAEDVDGLSVILKQGAQAAISVYSL